MRAPRVLANPAFRRLWIAQGISVFGDYLAMFAVQTAIVFSMHGSAHAVSAMLLASLLPGIAIAPLAGVFADRWNPRRTMVFSDGLRAGLVALLFAAHRLPGICAICFAISCVSAFFIPAQAVAIPLLVERESLLEASALMQQTLQVARIASPAAAVALATHFGENACYAADAASFIFSAVLLTSMRCEASKRGRENAAPHLFREWSDGTKTLLAIPALSFAALSMAGGTFAAGCYSALAGIYVRDVLHAGTVVYGAMGSLTALGTLVGAGMVRRIAQCYERETSIAAGMGVVGICIFLLAISTSIAVSLVAALGIGLGAAVALVASSATIRERTPAPLRGRMSSVSLSLMSAAQAAAILAAGSYAGWNPKASGIRAVYALSGAMLLAQPAYRCFRRGTSRSAPSACFQNLR